MPPRTKRTRLPARGAPPAFSARQVLTLRQWAELNSIGYTSARRLIKAGQGPRVIQVSPHRLGVRVADNDAWQAARVLDAR